MILEKRLRVPDSSWGGQWIKKLILIIFFILFISLTNAISAFAYSFFAIYFCDSTGAILTANDIKGHTITINYVHLGISSASGTHPTLTKTITYNSSTNKLSIADNVAAPKPWWTGAKAAIPPSTLNVLNSRIYTQYGTSDPDALNNLSTAYSIYPFISLNREFTNGAWSEPSINYIQIDGKTISYTTESLGSTYYTSSELWTYCRIRTSLGHTHNASGTYYSSTGNSSTHTKYTYCTDHGTDHTQNLVGTSEAHTDSNNDGECDKCGQVYRTSGYLDLNGVLNGVTSENIAGYGTANVYVAGRGTSYNVTDYRYPTAAGTSYTITPKANSGYTYLGVASGSLSGTMPSGNYGVYLKFGSNYTIAFDGNGATSGSTASESRVYSDSAKPLTANGFERKYYDFVGWNTKADGSGTGYSDKQSVNNLTSTVNGTVTLYAQWKDKDGYHDGKAIVYTITYTLYPKNGANIAITDPGNYTTYTIETPTFTLNNPSATNYSFEGWYGSGTNGSKEVTIAQGSMGDLHFEADWLPTKDPNKSSGKDQTVPYVKTTPITENKVKIAA